jgi:hypothetical protein
MSGLLVVVSFSYLRCWECYIRISTLRFVYDVPILCGRRCEMGGYVYDARNEKIGWVFLFLCVDSVGVYVCVCACYYGLDEYRQ